jgi:cytochrome P450/predicted O-linked N-acetylglucosamine transferase (SPINDLY family)
MATVIRPPGPKGHFLSGNSPEYACDPLGFLTGCARAYGDIVALRFGRKRVFLLNHPDHIEYVLVTGNRNFTKCFRRAFRPILGKGLLSSEGDFWLRQRRLAQPAFQRQNLVVHGETIVAFAERMLATWQDGETRDLHEEMMRLTLEIAAKMLFGIDVPGEAHDVGRALETALKCIDARLSSWSWLPGWLPTPNNLRLRRAIRHLDSILYCLIEQRRASGEDRDDLLSLLLHARVGDDGSRMTDRQLRDEAMTLFLSGHKTTALALSWTWYLLAQDRGAMAELETELQAILGGRAPTVADLPQLRYTERVVMESMRLYPPAFAIGREAIQDCKIGGYDVPAGTMLLLVQWVLHRDPRYFDNPDKFQPNRWADGLVQRLPKYAYFPFGGGPRLCIGNTIALMIAVLAVATIAQKFRVALAPGHAVTLWPAVTLRPRHGIKLVLKARRQRSAVTASRTSESTGRRPQISLCMIVKNEESNLTACLNSAAHLVDEIVVVDTGSTDNTKAVATSMGARVVDFTWSEDFAAARNESLRHARGKWIFYLDADERIDPDNQQRLRDLFAGLEDENTAYTMRQLSPAKTRTGLAFLVGMVRLFRNNPRLRWQYRIHEQILPALMRCGTEIRQTEITIEHLGYQDADRLISKLERNLHLSRLEYAEHPDDPFILFNLGFVYLELEQAGEALPLLRRSLELAQPSDPFVRMLFAVLARSQDRLGQKVEALATLRTGRAHFPDDPELLFLEGVLLGEGGNFAQAEECLVRLLRSQEGPEPSHLHPGLRGYLVRHYLAGVYCTQGRAAEAEAEWRKALADWSNFTPAWRGLGELYAEQARWDDFSQVVEQMKTDPQAQVDAAVLQAEGHLARGQFSAAREILDVVIAGAPQALWPHEVLSRTLLLEGKDWAAAENALCAVLEIEPNHPEAQYNLAMLLRQQGNAGRREATSTSGDGLPRTAKPRPAALSMPDALRSVPDLEGTPPVFRETVESDLGLAEAYFYLGHMFLQKGKIEQAVAAYRQGLCIRPQSVAAYNHLGKALQELGRLQEAGAAFRQALTLQPNDADTHNHLGSALCRQGKLEEAVACYQRALEIHPDHYGAHCNRGMLFAEEGKMDEATRHYHAALAVRPTSHVHVLLATLLPPIYQSREDMRAWRLRLTDNLHRLHQDNLHFDLTREVVPPLFRLAYQGENDRDIQRTRARIYAPGLDPAVLSSVGGHRSGKIRVGVISKFLKNHTIGLLNCGLIANLSREHFSVIVLALESSLDPVGQFIRQHADENVALPENLPVARRIIADLRLDVLFYTDIGMDPWTYTLAFSRLAPVQCVTWGHPVTTGIPTIDYFVSSHLLELDGAEDHYTETLIRLKGLPIYYYRPPRPSPLKERSYFGLSDDSHLYACPQPPFKFHPEFDEFLGTILRYDPRGQLALIRGKFTHWDELLKQRFAVTIPDVVHRIRVVPPQSRDNFLNLMEVTDVLLDPIYFGGGNTSYEGLAVGVPIVTLPGALLRGRITRALYQKIGVMDCVVSSRQGYVDLALELGTNRSYRESVRRKILAANNALYEDLTGIRELEEFFRTAVRTAGT